MSRRAAEVAVLAVVLLTTGGSTPSGPARTPADHGGPGVLPAAVEALHVKYLVWPRHPDRMTGDRKAGRVGKHGSGSWSADQDPDTVP